MRKQLFILAALWLAFCTGCSKDNAGASTPDGGKGGSMARFTIVGDHMYVVNTRKLKVYNVSNPQAPVFKNEVDLGWDIETIFPYGNNLFIGASSALYICSLADPANPKLESRVGHFRSCDPVVATGQTAYVTLRSGGNCGGNQNVLAVYDVHSLTAPLLKQTISLNGPYGLGVEKNILYVCDGTSGLRVYDISSPWNPKHVYHVIGNRENNFHDVIPHRGVLIAQLADGVSFYDISQPERPTLLSTVKN
jgi:hypothetical protein